LLDDMVSLGKRTGRGVPLAHCPSFKAWARENRQMTSTARGPKLVSLLDASTDVGAKTVSLLIAAESKKTYRLPFSASCIPLVVAALTAGLSKLKAALPPGETPALQDFRGGISVGVKDDGSFALILMLEDIELPLMFTRQELINLRTAINDALMLPDTAGQR
jgi:hypothetical protein